MIVAAIVLFTIILSIEINCDKIEPRVVKGQLVPIVKFPHVVFLKVMLYGGGENVCGASILNQLLLVTAAHCMDDINLRRGKIWAFVGHENINKVQVVRSVSEKYVHEDYDQTSHAPHNDIALLLLRRELPLKSNIQRVIINIQHPDVSQGYLAGWGVVDEQKEIRSFWLQSVAQEMRDPQFCARLLSRAIPGTFCAGSKNNNHPRPALGDSGSGLITLHRELLGVMSLKPVNSPAIAYYTNVTYFYPWLIRKAHGALQSTCGTDQL